MAAEVLAPVAVADDVRVATPLRARTGYLAVDGWTAWPLLQGEHQPRRWADIIDAGQALHRLLLGLAAPDWVSQRADHWADADRIAFGEQSIEQPWAGPLVTQLLGRLDEAPHARSQLVHADLTGNVLLHHGLPPAVIDLSLTWRPPAFSAAIVVVDALVWESADEQLLNQTEPMFDDFSTYLLRALVFRKLSDRAGTRERYEAALRRIDAHASGGA